MQDFRVRMESIPAQLLADRDVPQSLERGGEIANMDSSAFEVVQVSRAEAVGTRVSKA